MQEGEEKRKEKRKIWGEGLLFTPKVGPLETQRKHSSDSLSSRTVVQSKFFGDYDERGEPWSGYTGFRGPSNRLFKITDKLAGQHTMMIRLLRKHMLYLSAVDSPL